MLRSRNVLLIFLYFTCLQSNSQNIVPNPSFENYQSLPCDFITSNDEFTMYMNNWYMPTTGTPDIYSMLIGSNCIMYCLSTSFSSVGSQAPRTGTTMCGFYAYGTGDYREYIQVRLQTPLIVGKSYYAEFYVSTGDNNNVACNNIGMHFSTSPIRDESSGVLNVEPQIKTTAIVNDLSNWVKISGDFIATEAAEYLTIGNFNSNVTTSYTINIPSSGWRTGYYFIDDVSVTKYCNSVDSSTSICAGTTTTLSVPESHTVNWALADDPGNSLSTDATIDVSPLTTTTYVAINSCNEQSLFRVNVDSPLQFELPNDTTICAGQQVTLDATTESARYLWHDGSQNPVRIATTTGLYSIALTNKCGSISDEIFIKVDNPPSFKFSKDTDICVDENRTFNATSDNANYLWQDGSTAPVYSATDTGTYAVIISNACGSVHKSTTLSPCCEGVTIPNLITPNGDGMNDTFDIDCLGDGSNDIYIYNEWNTLVYHSKGYTNNWNGSSLSGGIYYYQINSKHETLHKGWIQVLP